MVKCNLIFSTQEPNSKNCLWAKPVSGGFILYLFNGGIWAPLVTVDDSGTPQTTIDDVAVKVNSKVDKVSSATVTNNFVAFSNTKSGIKDSGKKASDFEAAGTAATLIAQAVIGLAGGIIYKGTVDAATDLPAEPENGWQYIVSTSFIYGSTTLAIGDYLIYNSTSSDWDVIVKTPSTAL